MYTGWVRLRRSLLLKEANKDETPFYEVSGLDDMKLRYLRLVGRPFHFRKSKLPTYPDIPYGMPVTVVQEPSFKDMPNVTFLTLMLSRSCDFKIRSIVRNQTRGKQHNHDYHIVFVLATAATPCNDRIAEENAKYKDILQFNHMDNYNNITLSVLFSFHYVSKLNLPVKYIFKTDSDCVVNYPLLKSYITALPTETQNKLYMGRCDTNSAYNYFLATRKNFIPRSVILNELYIPYYVTGGGYVISYSILPRLLLGVRHLPFIGHNEDVNVGRGMKMMGIPCVNIKDKWIARYGCGSKEVCSEYVVLHPSAYDEEIIDFYSYVQWGVCDKDEVSNRVLSRE